MFPFIQIFQLNIPAYGVFLAISIVISGVIAYFRCKKANLNGDDFLVIVVCALGIGLTTAWGLYIAVTFSAEEILSLIHAKKIGVLFQGGMVYYGGAIGGFAGALIGAKIVKTKILDFMNPVVPCLPLAHAIGRIGCFGAGCCYGKPTNSMLGIAFQSPVGGAPAGILLFPVQLLEAVLTLALFVVLLVITKRSRIRAIALPAYLLGYATIRIVTEFFRADGIRGIFLGLSTSQWISLMIIFGVTIYFLFIGKLRKQNP